MYEVEAKLRVDCSLLEEIRGKILSAGGRLLEEVTEVDTYYAHPCRSFLATDEALRLRVKRGASGAKLTYKGPRLPGPAKKRLELEAEVEGGLEGILERLGFRPALRIVKKREYYEVGGGVVTIDVVESLGCFVEAETGPEGDPLELLNALGIHGEPVAETYVELALRGARPSGRGQAP